MRRAFLIAFFLGPLPFLAWSFAILRSAHPDLIALNLGSIVVTIPTLLFLRRFARRPMFLLCWFATGGVFFWSAVRHAVLFGDSALARVAAILLFPITGFRAMEQDGLAIFPIALFTWGVVAGFSSILRRSAPPAIEREEKRAKDDDRDEEEPPPPRPEPYVVPRPPPKPKGPAYTPPSKEPPPPRPKRVPGA